MTDTPADAIAAAIWAQTQLTLARAAWLAGEKRGPWSSANARRAVYDDVVSAATEHLRAVGFIVTTRWWGVSMQHLDGPKCSSARGLNAALILWLKVAKP
jgi:hypothetical protein